MPFDDPEEKQDETTMPQLRPQKSAYPDESADQQTPGEQNQGGNPEVVKGLMEMMRQYRTPPGPNGEYYKRVYPPMPEPEPEPTSGEKIMALRYPEGSPERERFWKPEKTFAEKLAEVIRPGRNLPPPSRLQIVKDPNAVGAGQPWPLEPQSIFRHFYPGMSEAELRPDHTEGSNVLPQSGMTSDRSQGFTSSVEPFGARSNLMQFAAQGASAPAAEGSGATAPSQPQHSGGYANEPRLEDYLLGQRQPSADRLKQTADYMNWGEGSTSGGARFPRLLGNFIPVQTESERIDPQNPLGVNIDPEIFGHMLPDNAGAELRELVKPERWGKLSKAEKAQIAALMGRDISAANDYASAVLSGKPRPSGVDGGESPYFGPEIDDLVHSSAWIDGRLKTEEKATLVRLIRSGDVSGATAFVRELHRRFWYEDRYPRWGSTIGDRLAQAGKIAKAYEYNKQWMVEGAKAFARNTDKCNEFVADVLDEAGLEVPRRRNGWGGPINAAEWADASRRRVGHWQIVEGPPQPGDVVAMITGHNPNNPRQLWAHVGLVVGPGRTASASTLVYPPGMIVINDWGFREDQLAKRVLRRYVP